MPLNAVVDWSDPANEVTNHPIGLAGASPYVRDEGAPNFRPGTLAEGSKGWNWLYIGPAAADHAAGAIGVDITTFVPAAGIGYTIDAPLKTGQWGWCRFQIIA